MLMSILLVNSLLAFPWLVGLVGLRRARFVYFNFFRRRLFSNFGVRRKWIFLGSLVDMHSLIHIWLIISSHDVFPHNFGYWLVLDLIEFDRSQLLPFRRHPMLLKGRIIDLWRTVILLTKCI